MPKKSFIDKTQAQHFVVVHRSQRDASIAKDGVSKLVLNPAPPSRNLLKKDKWDVTQLPIINESSEEEYEEQGPEDLTQFGIYYSDQDSYDYSKHLKPIGEDPNAVFMATKQTKSKKTVSFDLPEDVFASKEEYAVGLMNQQNDNVWDPSLDPTVREVLYALEDEAYVEEDLGDDFFANLQSEEPTLVEEEEVEEEEGEDWMREFKKYRETTANNSDDDTDPMDKRATLTQFSMTSSAMFRNKHLTLLDDQFDRLMMKEYSGSEDEEEEQPELTDTAIQEVLDEFLEKMQVKGKRVIPRLSPSEQIKMIRDGMSHGLSKEELKKMIQETYERQEAEYDSQEEWTEPEDPEKEFWDCQTIISTYSNIYNHPTLLEAPKKIQFNKKGFPVVDESNEEDESEVEDLLPRENLGIPRQKNETAEEKKERKRQLKQEKKRRREEKKERKEVFSKEAFRQQQESKSKNHRAVRIE